LAEIELLPRDKDLVQQCDFILSIVPPRDAIETAERISRACKSLQDSSIAPEKLYYLDLNAVSPSTARRIASIFNSNPTVRFIDGCIIGGVPHPKPNEGNEEVEWHCPSVIISGPDKMPDSPLSKHINIQYLNDTIGAASGLKMCFGINTKGFTALAIQSFTTAHRLGILPELRSYLENYFPTTLQLAEKGLVTMPSKAYRWVHEMLEISETVSDDGGFERNL
jgi:3-hydroxyisobutyrate dehydrogenase-like beta-hydroxyacid dehydrogenase